MKDSREANLPSAATETRRYLLLEAASAIAVEKLLERAEAAEAERDELHAQVAELQEETRTLANDWDDEAKEWERKLAAERDRSERLAAASGVRREVLRFVLADTSPERWDRLHDLLHRWDEEEPLTFEELKRAAAAFHAAEPVERVYRAARTLIDSEYADLEDPKFDANWLALSEALRAADQPTPESS